MAPCASEEQPTQRDSAKHEVAKTEVAVLTLYGMLWYGRPETMVLKVLRLIVHSDLVRQKAMDIKVGT